MRPQIPLDHILRVWSTSPSATVAACSLGISQRTLYSTLYMLMCVTERLYQAQKL